MDIFGNVFYTFSVVRYTFDQSFLTDVYRRKFICIIWRNL